MFAPTQTEVRQFFCQTYAKMQGRTDHAGHTDSHSADPKDAPNANPNGRPGDISQLTPLEHLAWLWIAEHPEYHPSLQDEDSAIADTGAQATAYLQSQSNPFLHLSMHLSISEQCSIDQPQGIRLAVERLTQKLDDLHAAHHSVMDALGDMLWDSQRSGQPPDGQRYVTAVLSKALA